MNTQAASSRQAPSRRVAIVAGGTAGHIAPGLAVAEAYRAVRPGVDLIFIGTEDGAERLLVPAHRYRLELIPGAPFHGASFGGRLQALRALWQGVVRARRLLRGAEVDVVIGFGGYASAGTLLAARSLGVPCAIHESNSVPGLANRLLARWVDRIYLGDATAAAQFPATKRRVVGIPIRTALAEIGARRQSPHDSGRAVHVLVTGGTLGSPLFNGVAPDLMSCLRQRGVRLEVRHQTGDVNAVPWAVRDTRFHAVDGAGLRRAYAAADVTATVVSFIDDMAEAYAWADIALTCGGNTMTELAVAAVPFIVVPMSAAAEDHQRTNVRTLARQTGVWWCLEEEWDTQRAADHLAPLCTDAQRWRQASERVHRNVVRSAAADLVADCESWLATREGTRIDD